MASLRLDRPGPGGSLGECVVCGKNFFVEVIMGKSVRLIRIPAFDDDLPVHEQCKETLAKIHRAGGQWSELPDGPLRRVMLEAIEEQAKAVPNTPKKEAE